jgi:predicted ATP-grasp superfamily ATP-dependent carboligase
VTTTVLVTDGEQRAALAVVRSLGRAGHRVHVCAARNRSLAGVSRHAAGQHVVADPLSAPSEFATDVLELVQRLHVDVLLPIGEAALLALLPMRRELADVRLPFPDVDQFRVISDKAAVLRAAAPLGIRVPAQILLSSGDDLAALDSSRLPWPVVLKPARSVVDTGGRRLKLAVRYAATHDQLVAALADLPPSAYPLLLQQRVVGPGIGIFLLLWEGRTYAVFAHRRLREKPLSGGVSVYRESVPADSALVERSRVLLEHFRWQGVAMIEYKVDAATGEPYLMEVNGRFWGSLQLAIDAGVDFPLLLVSLACGRHPQPVLHYREGIRSRWWLGDLDQLIQRFRVSPARAPLPPDLPGRGRALFDFLTLWRSGDHGEVFRWSDPRPGIEEAVVWLQGR